MATLVLGYRPPFLQRDEPHPDLRIFLEAVGEYVMPDQGDGQTIPNTGGERIMVGPTALALFGAWGVSGGPLFPVCSDLNGTQEPDRVRLAVVFSYWWF
ncbi:MAG TPA: hypothetical protein VMB50_10950 [Myxococcales bacterium]|nr:hypothetical protein [Myxococcales bacterium]